MRFSILKSGHVVWVDDVDAHFLSDYTWHVAQSSKRGKALYVATNYDGTTIYLHRLILDVTDPNVHVDHIDGNALDNRRSNLRIATVSQNCSNTSKRTQMNGHSCYSLYKGVCWNKRKGKWISYINILGVRKHLGYFVHEVDAAQAYNKAAVLLHKEFARINTI